MQIYCFLWSYSTNGIVFVLMYEGNNLYDILYFIFYNIISLFYNSLNLYDNECIYKIAYR